MLSSPGQSLDPATRAFMEPRIGHDFGRVRVHTDEHASASARAVNAQAYTVGPHIVFATGMYAPRTEAGKKLLAHELAHTVQQGSTLARATLQRRVACPPGVDPAEGTGCYETADEDHASQTLGQTKYAPALSTDELESELARVNEWLVRQPPVDFMYQEVQFYQQNLQGEWNNRHLASGVNIHQGGTTANALIQGYDASVRIAEYVKPAEELAAQIFKDVQDGKLSHLEGRAAAASGRNQLLDTTREKLRGWT